MKKYIITVINSVSETSMPYNEFVLYRYKMNSEYKQLVLVTGKENNNFIPDLLGVKYVDYNFFEIRRIIEHAKGECDRNNMKLVIHLHQPKSAIVFIISTLLKGYRKNTIFTVHSLYPAYNWTNKFLSMLTSLYAKQLVFVSKASFDYYPKIIKKIKVNNTDVIINGVDLKRIDKALNNQNIKKKKDEFRLVYVARMIPSKNHKFLVDMMSRLEDCKLILVGQEDRNSVIRDLINNKGLSNRIGILGSVSRETVYKTLQESDLYVSPSLVEGLPVSILEALYVGLPVIMSDIEPHIEVARNNENIKISELDLDRWVAYVKDYQNMKVEVLEEIRASNRKHAEKFSLDEMLRNYEKVYDSL